MSKEKTERYYKGEHGKISVSENDESEFKIGLFFIGEKEAGIGSLPDKSELRIAEVGKEIWDIYLPHRYGYEQKQSAHVGDLILSDGARLPSYRQEQKKERRLRSFFVMAHGHPNDLEIRVEIRDGKLIVMIKRGNGATPDNPVIRRNEIKIVAHIDEKIETILAELPKVYKNKLGFEFNKKSGLYEPMQTNSMRLKSKVRDRVETKFGLLDFVIEPAFDLGSGRLIAERQDNDPRNYKSWPIREFEKEVKGIYIPDQEDDLKAHPEKFGLTSEQIGELCTDILKPEREDLLEIAMLCLLNGRRSDQVRYGDIDVADVFTSKSAPGLRLLKPYLETGEKGLKTLIRSIRKYDTHPFEWR